MAEQIPTPNEIAIPIGLVSEIARFSQPTKHDLTIMRGDSFAVVFRLYREVDACGGFSPQTLAGLQGRMVFRWAPDHPLSLSGTVVVDTATGSGRVTVTATAAITRQLPDVGVFDLELHDGTDVLRKTIVRGAFRLVWDATS